MFTFADKIENDTVTSPCTKVTTLICAARQTGASESSTV